MDDDGVVAITEEHAAEETRVLAGATLGDDFGEPLRRRLGSMESSAALKAGALAISLATLLVTVACGTSAPPGDSSQPTVPSAAAPTAQRSETPRGSVRLSTDKQTYATREQMKLRVHNEMSSRIDVMGSLGALRGWRADGAQEPWHHGFKETTELVTVQPGETAELGPVPAPDSAGRFVLEISYLDPDGVRSAARTEIEVQAAATTQTRTSTTTRATQSAAPGSGSILLSPNRSAYAAHDWMVLRLSNGTNAKITVTSNLAGLTGWRLTATGREAWNHGFIETSVLIEVKPGTYFDLPPVQAPSKPGTYLLQVTFRRADSSTAFAQTQITVN